MNSNEIKEFERRIECLKVEVRRLREHIRKARERIPDDPIWEAAESFGLIKSAGLRDLASRVRGVLVRWFTEDIAQPLKAGRLEVVPGRESNVDPTIIFAYDHSGYDRHDTPAVLIIRRTRSEG